MTGLSPALSSACKMAGAMAAAPMAAVDLMNDRRETLERGSNLFMTHLPWIGSFRGKDYSAIFVPNIDVRNNSGVFVSLLLQKRNHICPHASCSSHFSFFPPAQSWGKRWGCPSPAALMGLA